MAPPVRFGARSDQLSDLRLDQLSDLRSDQLSDLRLDQLSDLRSGGPPPPVVTNFRCRRPVACAVLPLVGVCRPFLLPTWGALQYRHRF
jgi:hypothetical protein